MLHFLPVVFKKNKKYSENIWECYLFNFREELKRTDEKKEREEKTEDIKKDSDRESDSDEERKD